MLVTALSDALMLILSQSYHSFLLHSEVKFLLPSEPQDQKSLLGTSGFHRGLLSSSPSPNSPVSYPSSSIPSTSVELTSSTNTNTNTVSIGGYDIPLYMFTLISSIVNCRGITKWSSLEKYWSISRNSIQPDGSFTLAWPMQVEEGPGGQPPRVVSSLSSLRLGNRKPRREMRVQLRWLSEWTYTGGCRNPQ